MNALTRRFFVLALSLCMASGALAHGTAKPKRGGVVAVAQDLHFELVRTPGGVAMFIDDHDKPVAPTGFKGRITVLNGTEKAEAEWTAAGDRLEATGVKLAPGAKAVATLNTPANKTITVRFAIKSVP